MSLPFQLEGKRVVLVDTPGLDDTNKDDAQILDDIVKYITDM